MPLANADLSQYWANLITTTVNRSSLWPNLCNRSLEPRFASEYQATIQDVSNWGVSFGDHTVGNAWATSDDPDASQITMALDQVQESNTKLPWLQARLAPIMYGTNIATQRAQRLTLAHDSNMAAFFKTEASGLVAAQKLALGSNTNYIGHGNRRPSTDAAGALPLQAVDAFLRFIGDNNLAPSYNSTVGPPIGSFFMVFQPTVMVVLLQSLRDKGIQLDTLYNSVLRNAAVFDTTPFRGRLYGLIDLFTSTGIANPTADNGKWDIICGTTNWIYFAALNALNTDIMATMNRAAPNFEWHTLSAWGRAEVNNDFGFYVTIEAGST